MAGTTSPKSLFVLVPRVRIKTESGALRDMFKGDVLTKDVSKESVDHLTDLGFVGETSPFDSAK